MNEWAIANKRMNRVTRQLTIKIAFIVLSFCPDKDGMKEAYKEAAAANQRGIQLPVDNIMTESIGVIMTAWSNIVIAIH